MLYSRLNDPGTAFEPQRNLLHETGGLDGGGTLAADGAGNVWVAWHAMGIDFRFLTVEQRCASLLCLVCSYSDQLAS